MDPGWDLASPMVGLLARWERKRKRVDFMQVRWLVLLPPCCPGVQGPPPMSDIALGGHVLGPEG